MKKKIVTVIKIALFLLLLGVVLLKVSDVLEQKTSRFHRTPVFSQDTPIDVLIIGSSHVKNGVLPYYLWKDYGISSYNFASSGEKIQLSYYTLKDVIKEVNPKVVVLDAYLSPSGTEDGIKMNYGLVHEAIDYMDTDQEKIELSKILSIGRDENAFSFLNNIYAYHYRWKELDKNDFVERFTIEKGGQFLSGGSAFEEIPVFEGEISEKVKEGSGYEYLNKIMDLCEENGAQFLLINVPYVSIDEKAAKRQYTFYKCVDERGFDSIYFPEVLDLLNIDCATDFHDKGHVNVLGAKKVTDYVGNYLSTTMGVADHRSDAAYQSWEEFVKIYDDARMERAENSKTAYEYAMAFWDSSKYRVELVTYDGEISDKLLNDYANKNEITVSEYDGLKESVKNYVDEKLIENDFTYRTMMALVYDINNEDIVAARRFLFYTDSYREEIKDNE